MIDMGTTRYIATASVISGGTVIEVSAVGFTRTEAVDALHRTAKDNYQHVLAPTLEVRAV